MRLVSLLVLAAVAACHDGYDLTFTCLGGHGCPKGEDCPKVPLGSGGCDDIPGALGHEGMKTDAGVPLNCQVGLPYGNPAYGNQQVRCTCVIPSPGEDARWSCPI